MRYRWYFVYGTWYFAYLVESPSDGGPDDEAQPEERLETGERGGDIVGKLLGDNREAGREKGGVAEGLDYPDDEGQDDERVVALDPVQQPEQYGARARR